MIKNVVFMGTPDFAVGTLQALIDSEKYQVQAVFSQPDKPKGRGKAMQMPPVKELAVSAGIPVYQPVKIREPQWIDKLKELQPDVIVVVAFGQIIPKAILELPKYGCINVHASLLPLYRGAAPIQWAVINGDKESGVTTMRMDAGLDTGDMILKETVRLDEKETGGSLFDKLSDVGAQLLIRTLDAIDSGTAVYEKQPAESPTRYASMLTKKDGEIDWTKDARGIECLIRGLNPWPSAYTRYRGKTLKIWAADVEAAADNSLDTESSAVPPVSAEAGAPGTAPGTAAEVTKHSLKIRTGNGLLSIRELQPEGKKRMDVDAFLRGYPVDDDEKFG
ncbi:MAG: methionyl-tRNA formyltransferase [Lachnospiraceae bacterium]|nr:methionyl-tRNA formyltransferase [Lachnospiraceae bacterium]